MKNRKYTVMVDFDGTIVEHRFPEIGPLKAGVKEALTKLQKRYNIVISSCRASKMFRNPDGSSDSVDKMQAFLDANQIPYDRIDRGDEGKVVAVAYIDDRGIRFEDNWAEIADALMRHGN